MKNCLVLLLLTCLAPACAVAQDPLHSSSNQQGWFWYDDPALMIERPVEDAPVSVPDAPPSEASPTPRSASTGYSTSWLRENLPKLRDEAIDDPSPEKVRAYLYAQRLAMDRAGEFQATVAFVTEADPFLDQVSRFPMAERGGAVASKRAANEQDALLFDLSARTGIWFFYRSDCEYCHAIVPVLLLLKRSYNFNIMPISLDGLPLDPRLPNFVTDRGQAQSLGVEVTPSLFLVRPPNKDDVVPLAQGFVSMSELTARIIRMAYFHGWIDKTQYARTRIAAPLDLQNTDALIESNDPAEIVRQLRPRADAAGFQQILQLKQPR